MISSRPLSHLGLNFKGLLLLGSMDKESYQYQVLSIDLYPTDNPEVS
jgi:hypothetical protein